METTLAAAAASAGDVVDDAVTALKTTNVFVAKGVEHTDIGTIPALQTALTQGDHIVIVMIPNGSTSLTNDEIANKVLTSLKEPSVLGLYANGRPSAYSDREYVPAREAGDMMSRAGSVSMNLPEESSLAFIRQVHQYQAAHPEPVHRTGTSLPREVTTSSTAAIAIPSVVVLVAIAVALLLRRRRRRSSQPLSVRFKSTPGQVRNEMERVLELRSRLDDAYLIKALTDTGRHLEAYFRIVKKRPNNGNGKDEDINKYLRQLTVVASSYIKVHQEPQYYRNSNALMDEYSGAIIAFEQFMLEQVRSANADESFDTRQAAQILSATDLRTIRFEEGTHNA